MFMYFIVIFSSQRGGIDGIESPGDISNCIASCLNVLALIAIEALILMRWP